jgi:putative transposase
MCGFSRWVMNTFFVSTNTQGFRRLLQSERSANLFIETIYHYRSEGNYLLHEFVVMPNHIHLILTPKEITTERAMQLIKGGFSFRAKKAFGWQETVWQRSFTDRRLRDVTEYVNAREYLLNNPVEAHMCERREEFPYSSAFPGFELDKVPQRLKPASLSASSHA